MELKEMQNKKKVWCSYPSCTTTSFENKGTVEWQCFRHYPIANITTDQIDCISLEEKVDLLIEHLGLKVVVEPRKTILVENRG